MEYILQTNSSLLVHENCKEKKQQKKILAFICYKQNSHCRAFNIKDIYFPSFNIWDISSSVNEE